MSPSYIASAVRNIFNNGGKGVATNGASAPEKQEINAAAHRERQERANKAAK